MGCIYKITNTVNGKAYIGQTIHDAYKTRIRYHLNSKNSGSRLVKHAVAKYGKDAFKVEILHDGILPEFLDTLEIEAIAKFNTIAPHGYNLETGGNRSKSLSVETRRKISEIQIGKKRGPHSLETRRKMSDTQKSNPSRGMLGKKHSELTRRKMSEAKKGAKNHAFGKPSSNRGNTFSHSEEARRKISKASKKNPYNLQAQDFWNSLPADLSRKEKRKRFLDEFSSKVPTPTLYGWLQRLYRNERLSIS